MNQNMTHKLGLKSEVENENMCSITLLILTVLEVVAGMLGFCQQKWAPPKQRNSVT